jgi:crossover junction endodeoxyribonuclease RusA
MIVSLPFPDSKLFPNRKNGKHWTTTNAAKVAAREGAEKATKQAQGAFIPKGGTLPLSIVFVALVLGRLTEVPWQIGVEK